MADITVKTGLLLLQVLLPATACQVLNPTGSRNRLHDLWQLNCKSEPANVCAIPYRAGLSEDGPMGGTPKGRTRACVGSLSASITNMQTLLLEELARQLSS